MTTSREIRRSALVPLLVALTLWQTVAPAFAAVHCPRTSEIALEPQVMCLVCGIPLAVAESPQADRERAFIVQRVNRCETAGEIEAALVAEYGPTVLSLPPPQGLSLSVYLIPILGLLSAAGGIAFAALRARRRTGHVQSVPQAVGPYPTHRELALLDAELSRDEPWL